MYFKADTGLPEFIRLPKFVLHTGLSLNAKLLYALVLDRTALSQRRGWTDEQGRVYVIYTVRDMAADLGRSERTMTKLLRELETAGLVSRSHQGRNRADLIYALLPDGEAQKASGPQAQKSSGPEQKKASGPEAKKASGPDQKKFPPSKKDRRENKQSQTERVRTAPACFGPYENVWLTPGEREALEADFPGRVEEYIRRLSLYLERTGKTYASHEAALRTWLTQDRPACPAAEQAYGEDECL